MCYDEIADESYGISKECENYEKMEKYNCGRPDHSVICLFTQWMCRKRNREWESGNAADNVIITETGETLVQEQPTEKPEAASDT